MTVWIVQDRESDMVYGVFSSEEKAEYFIQQKRDWGMSYAHDLVHTPHIIDQEE